MNSGKDAKRSDRGILRELRNRPFKVDIVFLFCAILIPTVIAVTTFTYKKNSAAALEMTNDLVEKITGAVIEKTSTYMKPAQVLSEITSHLLREPNVDIGPGSDLEDYLISILMAQPQIDFIYYGTESGDFIDAIWPNEAEPITIKFIYRESGRSMMTYRYFNENMEIIKEKKTSEILLDPRKRPWYKGAKSKMATCWTDPYIFVSTGKPGITAACPVVTKSGKFLGVVAADITLSELSTFLKGLNISENGMVFILDKKRQLVAFPDPDRMVKVKDGKMVPVQAVDLNDKRITNAIRTFEDSGKSKFTYEGDGERILAFFTPFPAAFGKDWTIVVLAPEDDFLGPIKRTHHQTLIISGFILLMAVGCGLVFARNLSKPIEKLTHEVQKIREFELEGKVDVSSYISEIQMMSDAVDSMKNGLKAFRRYVPAALVRQLIDSGEEAKPGGRERELTLFFSDVNGFTGISERIPARELMLNLSEYMEVMSRIISKQRGTVDKYIGDAVMAFWGAPLQNEEHATCACSAALECQRAVNDLNQAWGAVDKFPFQTRMGLHTGFTIVGNMGSEERLNYTVLGDSVNLASRLEGVNKVYGTNIIISQATHRYARNDFITRPLDIIAVKGKINSVMIYELMGDDLTDNRRELKEFASGFGEMFDLYLERNWKEALKLLEDLQQRFPDDKTSSIYVDRLKSYLAQDPGPDWSGIIRLKDK